MIILIDSVHALGQFGIEPDARLAAVLKKLWPGPVSIIFPCSQKKFEYLHRGTKTLAFRLPRDRWLRALLKHTGPLVAPSANTEGEKPATTISEAKQYFGNTIDFYINGGVRRGKPSTVIEIKR